MLKSEINYKGQVLLYIKQDQKGDSINEYMYTLCTLYNSTFYNIVSFNNLASGCLKTSQIYFKADILLTDILDDFRF